VDVLDRIRRRALRQLERSWAAVTNPRAALYRATAPLGSERLMRIVTAWPVTYWDKVRYKMVRDRRPLIADFADKVRAKEVVARLVGREYAVETLAVFDDAASIRTEGLPEEFVVKVSHATKGIVFVRRDAPADARLPEPGGPRLRLSVRPEAFDVGRAREVLAGWLAEPHGVRFGEWAYSVHPPRIVVEPMLRTTEGEPVRDVKLHVMNGRVATYMIIEEGPDGPTLSDRYLRDGTRLAHVRWKSFYGPLSDPLEEPLPTPRTIDEMIDVAERVAAETDYVRVDMLDLGDRCVIGELTNYPASGLGKMTPASFARWLGRQWKLPASYDRAGTDRGRAS
jgi:hypothetical protein